ncbi:FAD-dependent oxidoreductase [Eggerthella lenta]|uniref:FAD-dependent oxidoreductase n=1 Tax=Eggerthella lenta TaxID=84112 RepID=UPI00189D0413|nr:FAD-dependent oxidoreductase [Eggerthella lenta]
MGDLSRRSFLRGALVAGASLGAVGLVSGCSPQDANGSNSPEQVSTGDIRWDKEADVVIVGFGAAGSAAAIEATEAGSSVIIIEKSETGGGSTALNGGFIYLGGTPLQEKLGVEDSADEMFKYLMAAGGEFASEEAIRLICDHSADTYEWCTKVGIKFPEVLDDGHVSHGREGLGLTYTGNERARGYRDIAKPAPRGHVAGADGSGFFDPLKKSVEASGAEIVYKATADHLIVNEQGRVIGVQATYDGGLKNVKAAKAVILAGGGFTNNEEMVFSNVPYMHKPGNPVTNPNEDGSCIKMGQEIGADLFGMSNTQFGNSIYSVGEDACKGILINANGRRFIAEDEYGSFVGEKIMQVGPRAYLITDSSLKGLFEAAGTEPLAQAETVEELAAMINVDPSSLSTTVSAYNGYAAAGVDGECGKEEKFLAPIETAPFYAYDYSASKCYYMTQGGLKVDVESRVYNAFGDVIPGLYAAGRASNITYGHYMGSGTSMTDCFVFGRIAGQNASADSSW